jgi:curved DNA-binding protein CbpA
LTRAARTGGGYKPSPVRSALHDACPVAASRDPYAVLGVASDAPDADVRAAYRRLVQLHHPDHNGGSAESARRFEEVQEAYAEIHRLRQAGGGARARSGARSTRGRASGGAGSPPPTRDSNLEARLAEIERQLREANLARERARRAAREAAKAAQDSGRPRASDEELGYVSTDDSFMKILADARDELFGRAAEARDGVRDEVRDRRVADRAADALEDIAARLRGERPEERS